VTTIRTHVCRGTRRAHREASGQGASHRSIRQAHPHARFEFLSWFDGIVVSGEEGVIKPDPRIFRILLERCRIAPGEAVFIDDNPGA